MGRQSLPESERLDYQLKVRLTQEDLKDLREAALINRTTAAALVRQWIGIMLAEEHKGNRE